MGQCSRLQTGGDGVTVQANLIGDGAADNSDLLRQAQLAALDRQERVVVGPGKFRFTKPVPILVPTEGEGLAGKYANESGAVPSGWNDVTGRWDNSLLPTMGTQFILDPPDPINLAEPFFQVHLGSGVLGIMFIEALQDPFATSPLPHPPVIGPRSNYKQTQGYRPVDVVLRDLWFVNNYHAIKGHGFRRHHISNIYGNPLAVGIELDDVDDLGELENVHFHSGLWKETQYDSSQSMLKWISANRIAFGLGQVDDLHASNLFVHGAKYGVRCFPGGGGSGPYGKLANVTLEMCRECIRIDDTTGGGGALSFSNFEFIVGTAAGAPTDDETGISVRYIRHGPVKFSNGVIRVARGHGVDFAPLVGGGPNAAFELEGVDVYDFGLGSTPGKAGIYINTRAIGVFPRVLVRGGMIRGGSPNAAYGILYDGNARAEFSGGEISQAGSAGFYAPGSVDFRLRGKRIFFCGKAIQIINADRFVVTDNLITDNTYLSSWFGVNGVVANNNPPF